MTITVDGKEYFAIDILLQEKHLLLIRGKSGYVMCGYLDMSVADKFNDVAVKVVGVSSIDEMLKSTVHSSSRAAEQKGIICGMPVTKILPLIF